MQTLSILLCLSLVVVYTLAVERGNFKTCEQSSFCTRNRDTTPHGPFSLDPSTIDIAQGTSSLTAMLTNTKYPKQTPLLLSIDILHNSMVRMRVQEDPSSALHPRYAPQDILEPEALSPFPFSDIAVDRVSDTLSLSLSFGDYSLSIDYFPFQVTLFQINGKEKDTKKTPLIVLNSANLFNFEVYQSKPTEAEDEHLSPHHR